MKKLINLTPHPITIVTSDGGQITVPPSGVVARVSQDFKDQGLIPVGGANVPAVSTTYGKPDLPDPQDGVLYLTSGLVAQAAWSQGRTDVVAPDTSPQGAVRDDSGRIVAVKRLLVAPDGK